MTFGLTPQGFNAMRLADAVNFLDNAFIATFGDVNLDPQSVFGQFIGTMSKSFADFWDNLEEVYFSQYPNTAAGVSLDNAVQLNGITRIPQQQTLVTATCSGNEGTNIPINSLASIPSTNTVFYSQSSGIITRTNADNVILKVVTVAAQPYTVTLNNQSFVYSLPIITFSNSGAIFASGDTITLTLNGLPQPTITYATSSDNTLALIAAQIAAFIAGTSATPTNPNIITIAPASGTNITVNNIVVTSSGTAATWVITYAAPANQNAITAQLSAIINAGTPPWLAVDNMDGTFAINANNPSIPFNCNFGLNLNITYQASPINFLCENYGPVACPTGALTNIVTPINGWNTVNNFNDGILGRFTETDAQLRIRRLNTLKLFARCTVDAIESHLLNDVPGVTSAVVFENTSATQQTNVITFPGVFVVGDTVTITYNTSFNVAVGWAGSQAATMAAMVSALEALPQVLSASYGGVGNEVLTINFNPFQQMIIDSATSDTSLLTGIIIGGRPPKSIECVVQGGTQYAIANTIWLTKAAGIETFGNVNGGTGVTITDSQGNPQIIYYSTPTPIYISVQIALTLNAQETFPVNGIQLVQQAIFNYGQSLGVGINVLFQRVLSQIFQVPGIDSGSLQLAFNLAFSDPPSYGTSDITITDTQISVWNLETIFVTVV